MCKIPKVVVIAPADKHTELRKALGSLEYDIAATVATTDEATGIRGDVAIAWEPDETALRHLQALGFKTVAVGGSAEGADMTIDAGDVGSFKTRIWELFRPS